MRRRQLRTLLISCAAAAAVVLAVAATPEAQGPPPGVPAGFQDSVVFDGLREPVAFRFAPDGRVFVAEKRGTIQVFDGLDDDEPTLFADLRKQVYDYLDHGLLGLALPPGFPADPHVFAMYSFDHVLGEDPAGSFPRWGKAASQYEGDTPCTAKTKAPVDSCPSSGRLVKLVAEGDYAKGGAATPDEEVVITDWCGQSSTHSIGDLEFGPEGALYASGGEGAMASTPDYGQFGWTDAEVADGKAQPEPQERVSRANQCGDPPGEPGTPLSLHDAEGGSLRSQDILTPASPGDPTGLAGTVIRIDPETGEGMPENPFHASASANERRIVAFGFRNPFRFAIHPQTGEVYVNNVAGGPEEEIDRFAAIPVTAYNSGWPCNEGAHSSEVFEALELKVCEDIYADPSSTSYPFFGYSHHKGVSSEDPCTTVNGSAISGSAFYEGDSYPDAYDGALFFSDSVRGCIYVMFAGEFGTPDPTTVMPFVHESDLYPGVDIQIGPDGLLYYSALFDSSFGPDSGTIHRVAYFSDNQPPVARLTGTPEWGPEPVPEGFKSVLDASGSSDPEDEMLTYEWDLDGDGVYEETGLTTEHEVTYHDEGEHLVAVRVKDQKGASSVARVHLYPGDSPPQVSILKPVVGGEAGVAEMTWKVGDPIEFEGVAYDAEDAEAPGEAMPGTSLSWSSRLFHCPGEGGCHAHPLQAFPSIDSGVLTAPDHEYPARIELKLTATDSRGLTTSKTIVVRPVPVTLSIESNPPGIDLTAGFVSDEAPFTLTAIEKSSVTLSAPQNAEVGGVAYDFVGWSDAGARVHTIAAGPSQTQYTATYEVDEVPDVALTIGKTGTGNSTISCVVGTGVPGPCAALYDEGTQLTVTATPNSNSAIASLSGTGSASVCATSPCAFVLTDATTLTAEANLIPRSFGLNKTGAGIGTVACKVGAGPLGPCASSYGSGTQIEVVATPGPHSAAGGDVFDGSSGSAQGCAASPCSFEIVADTTLRANFSSISGALTVTQTGNGGGSVSCDGRACVPSYPEGTELTLSADATVGSRFTGWSGAGCSGVGICAVTIGAGSASVAAEFALIPPDTCATNFALCPPEEKTKPFRCRKGFKKKKVRGKPRCVKVRKHRGRKTSRR